MRRRGVQAAASAALVVGLLAGPVLGQPRDDAGPAARGTGETAETAPAKPAPKPSIDDVGSVTELAQRASASAARSKEAAAAAAAQREAAAQHVAALKEARGKLPAQRRVFEQAWAAGKRYQRQHAALSQGAKPGDAPKGVPQLQKAEAELTKATATGPETLLTAQTAAELEAALAAAVKAAREAATQASGASGEARAAALALKKRDQQLRAANEKTAQGADTAASTHAAVADALQRAEAAAKEAHGAALAAKQDAAKAQALAGGLGIGKDGARATKEAAEIKSRLDDAVTQLAAVRAGLANPAVAGAAKPPDAPDAGPPAGAGRPEQKSEAAPKDAASDAGR